MYEKFTDRARKILQLANQEALRFNHECIGTEHLLLGVVCEGCGVASNVLKNLDIDLRKIRLEVEKLVEAGPTTVMLGKRPHTPRAKKAIEYAMDESRELGHNYVGTEHILLGLLRESEGIAAQVLMNLGLKLDDVRETVLRLIGSKKQPSKVDPVQSAETKASVGSTNQNRKCPKCGATVLPSDQLLGNHTSGIIKLSCRNCHTASWVPIARAEAKVHDTRQKLRGAKFLPEFSGSSNFDPSGVVHYCWRCNQSHFDVVKSYETGEFSLCCRTLSCDYAIPISELIPSSEPEAVGDSSSPEHRCNQCGKVLQDSEVRWNAKRSPDHALSLDYCFGCFAKVKIDELEPAPITNPLPEDWPQSEIPISELSNQQSTAGAEIKPEVDWPPTRCWRCFGTNILVYQGHPQSASEPSDWRHVTCYPCNKTGYYYKGDAPASEIPSDDLHELVRRLGPWLDQRYERRRVPEGERSR